MLSKEMIGASTIPIILTILLQGEEYGYQIIKNVKAFSGGKFEWSEPMLYPVLHRLERNGLIKSRWQNIENGRRRKYYSITSSGREALEAKKSEWTEMMIMLSKMWNLDLKHV